MRKSIDNLKNELNCDVALFHHVDGCYTTLGKAPEGIEPGSVCWTTEGKRLIVKDVIALTDAPRHYRSEFLVLDDNVAVIDTTVFIKPKKVKLKLAAKADDGLVGSMTKQPNP